MGDMRVPEARSWPLETSAGEERRAGGCPARRRRTGGGETSGVGSAAPEAGPPVSAAGQENAGPQASLRVHAVAGRRLQRSGNDACRLSDVMALHYEIRQQMSCSVLHRNVFLYPGLIRGASERKQGEKRGPFGAFYSFIHELLYNEFVKK